MGDILHTWIFLTLSHEEGNVHVNGWDIVEFDKWGSDPVINGFLANWADVETRMSGSSQWIRPTSFHPLKQADEDKPGDLSP